MANVQIRLVREADAAQVAEIYADYVENTTASLETEPPTVEQLEARIRSSAARYPFLVCELDGRIVAYAYAFRRFEEQSFDWGVFLSTFVSSSVGSLGIGRALLDALEETLQKMGIVNIYSLAVYNSKSEYFHLARGFTEAGRLREAVYKQGKWRSLAYYQKSIALHDKELAPVRPISDLDEAELATIFTRAERGIRA